jgi:uncharacterized protein YciI
MAKTLLRSIRINQFVMRALRSAIVVVICCAATLGGVAFHVRAQQRPDDNSKHVYSRANKKTIEAYVVLLRLRQDLFLKWKDTGKWPDDKEANTALNGHGKYWAEQLKSGTALLAGGMKGDYWDNVAMIIFEASSEAEAQRIVKDDPAVKAYVFQAQVRPFDISFVSDKYGSGK